MKKENKNFLYNIIYQVFSLLMPLITAPYIARVLGVDNIGTYAYTHSIVEYFMLAALIGINNYGSREISKASQAGDRSKLSKIFCEIYYLQCTLGIIMLALYVGGALMFAGEHKGIMLIQSIYIISAIFDINWFYFGLEKFKITVSRNIIIKLLSLVLIFIFVKSEADLVKYTLIMSVSALVSQLYLWIHLRKYIDFVRRGFRGVIRHFKECLVLFIPVIAYSIYRIMDKTMLGAISGTTPLGYYQNAENIINIPVTLIAALGTVMLPNMSKKIDKRQFNMKIFSSFELMFLFIIPMFVSLFNMGPEIATVFYGDAFVESGSIIRVLAITIVFSAIANVIRTNYLIPRRKDKVYVVSTVLGAVVNLILNSIFIPLFGVYGACIGTVVAEFTVMAYQIVKTRRVIDYKRMGYMLSVYILKSLPIYAVQFAIGLLVHDTMVKLICSIAATAVIFLLLNYRYILHDFFGMRKKEKVEEGVEYVIG